MTGGLAAAARDQEGPPVVARMWDEFGFGHARPRPSSDAGPAAAPRRSSSGWLVPSAFAMRSNCGIRSLSSWTRSEAR
jgi:hypothetical protein